MLQQEAIWNFLMHPTYFDLILNALHLVYRYRAAPCALEKFEKNQKREQN